MSKPLLRGHFHQAAFFVAIGACILLIMRSETLLSAWASVIYSLSLIGLFGVSALYHRPQWNPDQRRWMRRLDHCGIYFLIAGTGTPICLLGLGGEAGNKLLLIFWIAALFGVIQSLFWVNAPKWVASILYVAMGWLVFPYLSELKVALGVNSVFWIMLGGLVYSLGAVIYALKRPDPFPKVFGYHEIFHVLVILGAAFHFVVIYRLIH